MTKFRSDRNHQPHMRGGEFVQSRFIAIAAPAHREEMFFLALEERGVHRRAH
jgi:hypothetical protein